MLEEDSVLKRPLLAPLLVLSDTSKNTIQALDLDLQTTKRLYETMKLRGDVNNQSVR